uniref:Uncharacterized protein n=1 Tax=Chromera velia CCMP2878 TaxID=1169474 RepID=A0A0G4GC91_9ALVE|mmetsp:Transcript_37132/g.73072  ORF Transcript_37132/g.73072 Transcript_37132/m.73072 type:complete len:345 (-) Transcript_37132:302-1336(-)|eukprot:Cvel_21268.t1-p1 / transcript=Cvel_21268.t1 / gene=Cvel_21268 / organism=Chromera_velia_CCMP2878 / gene_product=hypothetical protein / transcript_product=hypothetical protein / location=Cvel_scaffold1979:8455-11753(+) / protein_length=344 / sequence_SO=supercontig / SO=protein_coding / is_pseudo=false
MFRLAPLFFAIAGAFRLSSLGPLFQSARSSRSLLEASRGAREQWGDAAESDDASMPVRGRRSQLMSAVRAGALGIGALSSGLLSPSPQTALAAADLSQMLPPLKDGFVRLFLINSCSTELTGKTVEGQTSDAPLNSQGQKEAAAIAEALKSVPLTAVVSSEKKRALQTADTVYQFHSNSKRLVDEGLDELNLGALEGKPASFENLVTRYFYESWGGTQGARSFNFAFTGESGLENEARTVEVVQKLTEFARKDAQQIDSVKKDIKVTKATQILAVSHPVEIHRIFELTVRSKKAEDSLVPQIYKDLRALILKPGAISVLDFNQLDRSWTFPFIGYTGHLEGVAA